MSDIFSDNNTLIVRYYTTIGGSENVGYGERVSILQLKTHLATVFAPKAGSLNQDFSVQKLTLPNGFTIETDANYLDVKKNGTICSKVSLTARLSPDHQEL